MMKCCVWFVCLYENTYIYPCMGRGRSQAVLVWPHQAVYFFDKSNQIFVIMAQMTIPLLAGTLLTSPHCLHLICYLHFVFFPYCC